MLFRDVHFSTTTERDLGYTRRLFPELVASEVLPAKPPKTSVSFAKFSSRFTFTAREKIRVLEFRDFETGKCSQSEIDITKLFLALKPEFL